MIPAEGPGSAVLSPDGAGRVARPAETPAPKHPQSGSGSSVPFPQARKHRPGSQEAGPRRPTGLQGCDRAGLEPRPAWTRPAPFLWQLWPASSWPHLGLTLAFLGSLRTLQQSRNPPSGTLGTGAFVLYLRAGACEQISRVTRGNVWLPGVAVGAICSPVLEPPLEPPRPAGPQGAL